MLPGVVEDDKANDTAWVSKRCHATYLRSCLSNGSWGHASLRCSSGQRRGCRPACSCGGLQVRGCLVVVELSRQHHRPCGGTIIRCITCAIASAKAAAPLPADWALASAEAAA